jgi:DNA-binding SARP family transcriptional activator
LQETLYLRLADAYYQSGRRADARTALDRANGLAAMLGENGNSGSNENDGKYSSGNAERRQRLEWLLSLKQ